MTCTCFFSTTSILPTCFYFLRCSLQSKSGPHHVSPSESHANAGCVSSLVPNVITKASGRGFSSPGLKSSWTIEPHIAVRMKVPLIVLILSGVGGASPDKVCSYQDVVDHLKLTSSNRAFQLTRPVLDHTHPTMVELNIILYGILGVIEKTQTFIPFLWVMMSWKDERIFWEPGDFCGITEITIPTYMLWKPDVFILEMVEKDNSQYNPYLLVNHNGIVTLDQDIRAVSMCMMDVHKFPFDTQSCNITLVSAVHLYNHLRVIPVVNSSRATQFTKAIMHSQGEWDFLHLSVSSNNITLESQVWDQLVYTFVIKRRPLLHVINFLLPILFFLCLDLASFFIPDRHGEKLGFKVTVLLAISVLLLILNDILPSMSNKTPLIATYCIVIFALMLISLLETIMVAYLFERDSPEDPAKCARSKPEINRTDKSDAEEKKQTEFLCTRVLSGEKQRDLRPEPEEQVDCSVPSAEAGLLLLLVNELKELQRMLSVQHRCKRGRSKSVRLASKINKGFFFIYLAAATLFLSFLYRDWMS